MPIIIFSVKKSATVTTSVTVPTAKVIKMIPDASLKPVRNAPGKVIAITGNVKKNVG